MTIWQSERLQSFWHCCCRFSMQNSNNTAIRLLPGCSIFFSFFCSSYIILMFVLLSRLFRMLFIWFVKYIQVLLIAFYGSEHMRTEWKWIYTNYGNFVRKKQKILKKKKRLFPAWPYGLHITIVSIYYRIYSVASNFVNVFALRAIHSVFFWDVCERALIFDLCTNRSVTLKIAIFTRKLFWDMPVCSQLVHDINARNWHDDLEFEKEKKKNKNRHAELLDKVEWWNTHV